MLEAQIAGIHNTGFYLWLVREVFQEIFPVRPITFLPSQKLPYHLLFRQVLW
jgi:hypothetical protein